MHMCMYIYIYLYIYVSSEKSSKRKKTTFQTGNVDLLGEIEDF